MYQTPNIDKIPEIEAMRMGVDYSFPIGIRGFKITVRPISSYETIQVAAEVQRQMAKMSIEMKNPVVEHNLIARETLKIASTSDVGKQDWGITDHMMDRMTPDEIRYLFQQYVGITDKVNPCLDKMDKQELETLVDYLKKTPQDELDVALTGLTFLQSLNIIRHLLPHGERQPDS